MQIILAQPYLPGLVRQQVAARHPDASWFELPSADLLGPNPNDIASLAPASHDCLLFGDGMFANSTRIALFGRLKALGCTIHAMVFDHALVCPDVRIGIGSLVYPHAILDEGVSLGFNVIIGPGAVIEAGVSIGNHCFIGANCVIKRGSVIGSEVYLTDGTIVGGVHGYRGETTGVTVGRGAAIYDATHVRRDLVIGEVHDGQLADRVRVIR